MSRVLLPDLITTWQRVDGPGSSGPVGPLLRDGHGRRAGGQTNKRCPLKAIERLVGVHLPGLVNKPLYPRALLGLIVSLL